ncbi:hypothetical protein CPB83DRAFT_848048 [Crepidotus variabilis]|uniref:RING-type domain-containing protein n=1 Tax=Crepidotus variabilis TaxID=179855 RepID=A0A9P6EN14_9AGAR|nr:hypothetical protein CPB83DRAFT_848048 [Crepidotus variabilis]
MSSREPLWYCHECHAEMRPLMVPDPVCASCHGSFVEKMENPTDDPRQFGQEDDPFTILGGNNPQMDNFLMGLQTLMERGMNPNNRTPGAGGGSGMTFEVRGSNGRTIRMGGANTLGRGPDRPPRPPVPNMTDFLGSGPSSPGPRHGNDGPTIGGVLMAQYLTALLGGRDPGLGNAESGRMGDYVFNQEALDQVITQIMENSNSHRPVPATEDVTENLPRDVLTEGSPMLEKDCAVCKDQFKLGTDDPDEQVVITLPCKHPFHEPCILPWLKSSGTCPVCRYALVPQPDQHGSPPHPGSSPSGPSGSGRPPYSPGPSERSGHGSGAGLFQSLFGGLTGHGQNHATHNHGTGSPDPRRSPIQGPQGPQRRGSEPSRRNNDHLPGSWSEDLD